MITDDKYLVALTEINNEKFNKKIWLINNFELYKSTLNWPKNLPPINRSDLTFGSLIEKFNKTYFDILSEFDYDINNERHLLEME